MTALALIIATGFTVGSMSFWAIRKAAHRPANGEVLRLALLDVTVQGTCQQLNRIARN